MKLFFSIICFAFLSVVSGQDKYLTKKGEVIFEASVPSFEEVKAENQTTTAILDTSNGEFAALALVKGFRFKNALMEEHFNENYAESDTYPKATFKGNIIDFEASKLSGSASNFRYHGTLEFHGKTKQIDDQILSVEKKEDVLLLKGTFKVEVSDFDIAIPKVVSNKLSRTVNVSFEFELTKK